MGLSNGQKNKWYKLKNQNLAEFMRQAGFDLSVYDSYPKKIQEEVKNLTISEAISSLRSNFWKLTEKEIKDISFGVYVITLSSNMSVKYEIDHSPVIYIGQGNIEGRIKAHYQKNCLILCAP